MGTTDLVTGLLDTLPGVDVLLHLGTWIIRLAFAGWMLVELYKLGTQGRCNLVTPVLRCLFAYVAITNIKYIGQWVGHIFEITANAVYAQSTLQIFRDAVQKVYASFFSDAWSINLFSIGWRMLVMLSLGGAFIAMVMVKVLIIDLLHPLAFSLVLLMGFLAIPIGVFPGLDNVRGWVRNLIEVALWPVVFQLLVATLAAIGSNMLATIRDTDITRLLNDASNVIQAGPGAPQAYTETSLFLLFKFEALCVLYCLMTLFTPMLARILVQSTPVGELGGVVAAKIASAGAWAMGLAMGAPVAAAALSRIGDGLGGASSAAAASGGLGDAACVVTASVGSGSASDEVDQRNYVAPTTVGSGASSTVTSESATHESATREGRAE